MDGHLSILVILLFTTDHEKESGFDTYLAKQMICFWKSPDSLFYR